jgi:hypothetical protein
MDAVARHGTSSKSAGMPSRQPREATIMSYMLLIVEPRGQRAERSEAEGRQAYAQMRRFADDLETRGKLIACESLVDDREGTRVQVREGRSRLTDGPFAEAKEMVGGFFLLDCETREEALAIAADCPAAAWATVEVRRAAPCYE